MKKYWKLISIAVITVGTIGFFYIQSALAGSNYPEFEIETLGGNDEEVQDLVLYGNYMEGNIKGNDFQITAEGIQYNRDLSYFDRLDRRDRFPELKRLQQDYKSFMRGKNSLSQLAESETHIVYADVTGNSGEMSFRIEVLDKEDNEQTAFTVEVPDDEKDSFIYVEQVYMDGEKVKVVTRNHVNGSMDGFTTEIHVYEFNIGDQILTGNEMILSYSEGSTDQTMTHVYKPGDGSKLQSDTHAIFVMEEWETDEEGGYYSQFAESKVISIDMETNEFTEFVLPDTLQGVENTVLLENSQGDSMLYFPKNNEHGLEIVVIDLENEKMDEKRSFTFERDNINMNSGPPVTAIQDGKMYIITQTNEEYALSNIFVVDVQSGELLYEGQITGLNGNVKSMEYFFHIFDMAIR
ncbi:hypothetical protein [Virgibacillus sp. YIM 98842]|uniref:hypothetical protein n=1 Tax=Virgibacillus sp. YIM 98842 TaxID=2663533 RepID=UPI0013DBF947|nr:hypothetical protein [Virgibacillus sp. YIM 98842]